MKFVCIGAGYEKVKSISKVNNSMTPITDFMIESNGGVYTHRDRSLHVPINTDNASNTF